MSTNMHASGILYIGGAVSSYVLLGAPTWVCDSRNSSSKKEVFRTTFDNPLHEGAPLPLALPDESLPDDKPTHARLHPTPPPCHLRRVLHSCGLLVHRLVEVVAQRAVQDDERLVLVAIDTRQRGGGEKSSVEGCGGSTESQAATAKTRKQPQPRQEK